MNTEELIHEIHNNFEARISKKIVWVKNEIIRELDTAILETTLRLLNKELGRQ